MKELEKYITKKTAINFLHMMNEFFLVFPTIQTLHFDLPFFEIEDEYSSIYLSQINNINSMSFDKSKTLQPTFFQQSQAIEFLSTEEAQAFLVENGIKISEFLPYYTELRKITSFDVKCLFYTLNQVQHNVVINMSRISELLITHKQNDNDQFRNKIKFN